jgi:hypothetical protein
VEIEKLRKRALELADLISLAEAPYSEAVDQAREELHKHLQKLDSQTQKEVMERIRGSSD